MFSKMDAKAGYWSIHLDEASQELTTFRTPFGRYCYKRLPFGLCVSQDLFQQAMDRILARTPGCVGIADDVVVYGRDNAEHDNNLLRLMQVAREEGLVFNSKKCVIKTHEIVFFGSVYGQDGIRPDPNKVEDIHMMPTPQDKEDLQRCIGLMNYLAAYIPHFADKVAPLRELLKKDVPFVWHDDHQRIYDDLKMCISSESCLTYYNPRKETVLEVDASQKGLGACLLQNDKPVAFASKTLTPAQSAYSNIERETLAIVNGIQKFHTYLFGKPFVVITDHKPLMSIHNKPLKSAPPRLQRLLIRLQGYDFQLVYRPGSKMIIADVLSRFPNPKNNTEIPLDVAVDFIMQDDNEESVHSIDLINFSVDKRAQLRELSTSDRTLRALQQVVYSGWPDTIKDLSQDLRQYWSYRDEIGIADGVVFKGRQVIIPDAMRKDILGQLHEAHLGIEKTRRLMRESVYWPNIHKDIEMMVKSCAACQENQPEQQQQPLIAHDVPSTPWTKVASDLFHIKGDDYLLISDYHSKFYLVQKMHSTTSSAIAKMSAEWFSMFSPPLEIVTDNGPQYVGQPFHDMCNKWNIQHTTTSPRYAQSNGLIERQVRAVKGSIQKCAKTGNDVLIAIQHHRCTPLDSHLSSPSEILFNRPVRYPTESPPDTDAEPTTD